MINKTNLIQSSLAAVAVAFTSQLSAQTTNDPVSTPIVGFQKTTVPVGLSTAGFPLLNADLIKTSATSLSSNALTLSGETNVGAKLTAGDPYYIEVYTGSLKGDRFDVDTAATISAANGSVILNSSSGNNTYSVASIASSLDGQTIALRQHITLDQIRQMATPALVGNNSANSADQIQLFNPSTKVYEQYFLRGDGVTWRKVGTVDVSTKVPVPPGVGVFILKKTGVTDLIATGAVRNNDFARPLVTGLQLTAPGFPVDRSPQSLGMTSTNGWTANNSANSADQIQVYNPTTKAYDQYFLRSDGVTWRKVGTLDSFTAAELFSGSRGAFISRKTADSGLVINNPVSQ